MVVFTNGCFDVLHVGHINLLLFCRQLAGPHGQVFVSLDSDNKIKRDKGQFGRPIFNYKRRFDQIFSLEFGGKRVVDMIFEHPDNDILHQHIERVHAQYVVVGDSYKGKPVAGSDIANVVYFKQNQLSSSYIICNINERTKNNH